MSDLVTDATSNVSPGFPPRLGAQGHDLSVPTSLTRSPRRSSAWYLMPFAALALLPAVTISRRITRTTLVLVWFSQEQNDSEAV